MSKQSWSQNEIEIYQNIVQTLNSFPKTIMMWRLERSGWHNIWRRENVSAFSWNKASSKYSIHKRVPVVTLQKNGLFNHFSMRRQQKTKSIPRRRRQRWGLTRDAETDIVLIWAGRPPYPQDILQTFIANRNDPGTCPDLCEAIGSMTSTPLPLPNPTPSTLQSCNWLWKQEALEATHTSRPPPIL